MRRSEAVLIEEGNASNDASSNYLTDGNSKAKHNSIYMNPTASTSLNTKRRLLSSTQYAIRCGSAQGGISRAGK